MSGVLGEAGAVHGAGYAWDPSIKVRKRSKSESPDLPDSASQAFGMVTYWRRKIGVGCMTVNRIARLERLLARQMPDERAPGAMRSAHLLIRLLLRCAYEEEGRLKGMGEARNGQARARRLTACAGAVAEAYGIDKSQDAKELDEYITFAEDAMRSALAKRKDTCLLKLATGKQNLTRDGLWLEFGVGAGTTMAVLAERLPPHGGKVYGFDTFTGLPEDWRCGFNKGHFDFCGNVPEFAVAIQDKLNLVRGLFQDTLPSFLDAHSEDVSLLHIDCDLYSASAYVLKTLLERKRIKPGTVIIFDEMFGYCGYENGELRALFEVARDFDLKYRWTSFRGKADGSAQLQVEAASILVYGVGDDIDRSLEYERKTTLPDFVGIDRGLQLIEVPDLTGADLYNGGVLGKDGCVYGICADARRTLRVDTKTDTASLVGPEFPRERQKWLRGVLANDGCIYTVPCCSNKVLVIDTNGDEPTFSFLHPPPEIALAFESTWKWHGGVLGLDGNVYCVPANATSVLKIEVATGKLSLLGDTAMMKGPSKWYGGLRGADGSIICIPQNADAVLRIVPETQEVSLIGDGFGGFGGWRWHGGCYLPSDQCIYGCPNHANSCIRINPSANGGAGDVLVFGDKDLIGDKKYKFEGAVVGKDSCLYCIPGNADRVLKITPPGPESPNEEPTLEEIGPSFENMTKVTNKWQNGFECNGVIYASPCNAEGALRIDVATQEVTVVHPPSGPLYGLDTFQSGVISPDGTSFYCVPFKSSHVLKIKAGHPFESRMDVSKIDDK